MESGSEVHDRLVALAIDLHLCMCNWLVAIGKLEILEPSNYRLQQRRHGFKKTNAKRRMKVEASARNDQPTSDTFRV